MMALVIAGCGEKAEEEPSGEPEQQSEEQNAEQPEEQAEEPEASEEEQTAAGEEQAAEEEGQEFTFVASSEKPDACASCHIKVDEEKDYRLGIEVTHIEGHPELAADATVDQCMMCHKADGAAPPFEKLLHEVHLLGEENHFVDNYGGACNQCHKMADSGALVVKGLEKEGTKFVDIKTANVDLAENGCASCHVKTDEEHDYRLGIEVSHIEGHPGVSEDAAISDCITCHKDGNIGPAFKEMLHLKHFKPGAEEESHYANYGYSCRNCHSIAEDGTIGVKGI